MPTPLELNWSNEPSITTGGFTQDTGGINVTVSYTNDGSGTTFAGATTAQYVDTAAGETFNTTSSLQLGGDGNDGTAGDNETSTTTIDFSSVSGSGFSSEVENVSFRLNDFDTSSWIDVITVRAYDANGALINVNLTWNGNSFSGTNTTITSNVANGSAATETGSILVEIAGPVSYFEIDYNNNGTGGQALWVTDVHFDAIDLDGTVEGTAGNDVIDGTYITDPDGDKVDNGDEILPGYGADGDLIEAYGGDDTVLAGAGDDSVYAGTGNDSVSGGAGNDTVFLEDGNDTFGDWSTDAGNDTVYGGVGSDFINGGAGNDVIFGGADDDTLTGAFGDDSLYGGTGSDQFWITDDHDTDTIVGGENTGDFDTIWFSDFLTSAGVTVTSNGIEQGTYSFNGTAASGSFTQIEGLGGTENADTFDTSADNSGLNLYGGAGADTFTTGSGDDSVFLGDGAADGDPDVIILQDGFGSDTVYEFDAPTPNGDGTFTGIDTLDVSSLLDAGGDPVLTNDVIVSDDGSGNAVLSFPNGETLTLVGISPTDADDPFFLNAIGIPMPDGTVEGTSGADTINASYAGDPDGDFVDNNDAILPGDTGNDDLIYGYGGNDTISSGAGADEIYGGTGNDTILNGSGTSTIYGDAGDDTVYGSSNSDTIYGGADNDVINGNIGSDESYGGAGDDTITAGGFAGTGDTMDGGAGNDTLTGGLGNDTMTGGTGSDTFNVSSSGGTDSVTGGEDVSGGDVDTLTFTDGNGIEGVDVVMTGDESGTYDFDGESGNGTFSEIEQINLTDQDDSFDGAAATSGNTVDGGAGDDELSGSAATDSLSGGTGNDTITGLGGQDTLDGGDGDDVIAGDATNPASTASAGDAGQLYLDVSNVEPGSETGTPGDAQVGDSVIFNNAGTLPDGTVISVKVTVASVTDPDVTIDLTEGQTGAPLRVSGNGDPANAGEEVQFTLEFFDQATGLPIVIEGDATVTDIDDNAGAGAEYVSFSDADVSSYTVGPTSSITPDATGGTVSGTGTTTNNASDEDAWFGVSFNPTSELSMTVGVVEDTANYGFSGSDITGGVTTAVDGGADDSITGGAGNDYIQGDGGDDIIDGGADDDTIFGGTGSDTLTGGDGNDTITGGADEDVIYGGPGDVIDGSEDGVDNDTLYVQGAINIIYDSANPENGVVQFASGPDLVFSNIENVVNTNDGTVSGTAGDDVIDGSYVGDPDGDIVDGGDALISGHNANDDLIEAGAGNDQIDGGLGSDTIYAGTGNDVVFGGTDTTGNTIYGEAGIDSVFGGAGGDEIYGGADSDTLDGEAGADTIYGGTGNDQLIGDAGADTLFGGDGADTFYGGLDNDTIYGGDGNDTAYGGAGDDTMELWLGNDTAFGGTGNDYIDGAQGDDRLSGGDGNDTLLGGSDVGADELDGGAGDDTLWSGDGDDTLIGGTGADNMDGAGGDDVFVIENTFGNDTISGGETSEVFGDTLDASAVTTDLTLDLSTLQPGNPEMGTLSDGTSTATFEEIETIILGTGDDSVIGSSGDDMVATNAGADTINLGAGNDMLDLGLDGGGSDGDADVIILQDGSGNDTILNLDAPTPNGDGTFTGVDTFDVTNLNDADGDPVNTNDVTVSDDGSGNAVLTFPNGESVTLQGIDPVAADDPFYLNALGIPLPDGTVEGTSGADIIDSGYTGDPDGDMVDAGDAILAGDTGDDDLIYGYAGDDTITSGAGDDETYGGTGSDSISGGDGNDLLVGDTLANMSGDSTGSITYEYWQLPGATSNLAEAGFDENGNNATNPDASGSTDVYNISAVDTENGGNGDLYAIKYTTDLNVTTAGDYTFSVTSDDGMIIFVDGVPVSTNDGLHGATTTSGTVTLPAGAHTVEIIYFENTGGAVLNPTVSGPDTGNVSIPLSDADLSQSYDDTISAGSGDDTAYGGLGDDSIIGGTGNDTLYGGDGSDEFGVSDNHDTTTIVGGEDVDGTDLDHVSFDGGTSADGVTVTATGDEAGTFDFDGTTGTGSYSEIESFDGTNYEDTFNLQLDDAGTEVYAEAGDDIVNTGAGDDTIFAGSGADTLNGGAGADTLYGGTGNDTITFAEGDTAEGDAGDDLFVLEDLGEPTNGTITIDGGAGDETDGDTLQLGNLAVLTQDVIDTFVDDGTGSFSGSVTLDDGTILNFSEIENIICFTPSTRIATPKGLVPVEDLRVGDLVVTRDHGLQPIRWIEGRTVPGIDRFAPVRIRKNVLAGQDRDLVVSPQHRVLFQGYRAELLFGESEVLVSAAHLVDGIDVTQDELGMVTYIHMLFDQHEIIFAEGAATESFHPGDIGFSAVGDEAREELFAIFPELRVDPRQYGATARRCLKAHEGKLIRL